MRRFFVFMTAATAILLAGALASDAQISRGGANIPAASQDFTPIAKIACGGAGPHCRWRYHWVCRRGPYGRRHCLCVHC
jgi:hypothetical protein